MAVEGATAEAVFEAYVVEGVRPGPERADRAGDGRRAFGLQGQ